MTIKINTITNLNLIIEDLLESTSFFKCLINLQRYLVLLDKSLKSKKTKDYMYKLNPEVGDYINKLLNFFKKYPNLKKEHFENNTKYKKLLIDFWGEETLKEILGLKIDISSVTIVGDEGYFAEELKKIVKEIHRYIQAFLESKKTTKSIKSYNKKIIIYYNPKTGIIHHSHGKREKSITLKGKEKKFFDLLFEKAQNSEGLVKYGDKVGSPSSKIRSTLSEEVKNIDIKDSGELEKIVSRIRIKLSKLTGIKNKKYFIKNSYNGFLLENVNILTSENTKKHT